MWDDIWTHEEAFAPPLTAADRGPTVDHDREGSVSHVAGRSGAVELDISSLFDELDSRKVALVLGSEGQGLRQEILAVCHKVSIPMIGKSESLNVAAAGSMLMMVLSQPLKGVLQSVQGAMRDVSIREAHT